MHAREPDNFPPYLSLGDCARVRSGFGLSERMEMQQNYAHFDFFFLFHLFFLLLSFVHALHIKCINDINRDIRSAIVPTKSEVFSSLASRAEIY